MGWGLPGILKYMPSPTLVPKDHLSETVSMVAEDAVILDVGAGGRRVTPSVVTVDAVEGEGVDVVGDIHALPFDDDHADCVICTGTLEHVADPFKAVQELRRVLKPGGIVHIDVPFMQAYHADPVDYWRFSLQGLRRLCRDFEDLSSGVHIGPTCGVVWIIREWGNSLSTNRWISNGILFMLAILTAPLRYIDYWMIRKERAHHVASAVYFRGRKRAES